MNLTEICQSLQPSRSKFGNDKSISGVLSLNSRTYTIWIKCGLKKKGGGEKLQHIQDAREQRGFKLVYENRSRLNI